MIGKLLTAASVAALVLWTAAPAPAQAGTPITIAGAPGGLPHWLPVYVARAKFFADEGLDVDWVPLRSGSAEVAAVMGGSAQVAPVGIELPISAHENGGDLVLISAVFNVQPYSIVLSDAAIQKSGIVAGMAAADVLQRLKGLRIAITGPGSATDNFIRHALTFRGIPVDGNVNLQPLGDPDAMLAALQRKVVDGFVMSAPADQIAQQRNLGHSVLDGFSGSLAELKDVPFAGLVTSKSQLAAKPELFAAVLRAMTKSMRFIKDHPDDAKKLIQPYFADLDPATFDAIFQKYRAGAATDPVITPEQFAAALKWANIGAPHPIDVPYDAVVDTRLAKAAMATP